MENGSFARIRISQGRFATVFARYFEIERQSSNRTLETHFNEPTAVGNHTIEKCIAIYSYWISDGTFSRVNFI
jgi:hypothetical protein